MKKKKIESHNCNRIEARLLSVKSLGVLRPVVDGAYISKLGNNEDNPLRVEGVTVAPSYQGDSEIRSHTARTRPLTEPFRIIFINIRWRT